MGAILISGAASGLGRGFLRYYRQTYPKVTIFALDRNLHDRKDLTEHALWHDIDLTNEVAVQAFGRHLDGQSIRLDLVIHSAGARGLSPSVKLMRQADVQSAETLGVTTAAVVRETFDINCVGSLCLLKALQPSLLRAAAKGQIHIRDLAQEGLVNPKVVVMGSRMGSVGHNTTQGGGYAYRASKAALNAVVKSFSVDVLEVTWTILHPGRVQTSLVSIREDGALSVEEAVADCARLIDKLEAQHSGTFLDRFGEAIPW